MKCSIETITPSMAQKYLEKNRSNRRIRSGHVYRLRDEITGGRWMPNGATIVFGQDRLLDGQHRLLAIVAAKKAVKSLVVHGVPDEYFSTIDMGVSRKASDVMGIKGEEKAVLLAGAITWAIRMKNGYSPSRGHEKVSATEAELFLDHNAGIRGSVRLCHGLKIMSAAVAAAGHYLFSKKDRALADLFIDGVKYGCKTDQNDPVYVFRERMIQNMASRSKLHVSYQLTLMVHAWNSLRKGAGFSPDESLKAPGTLEIL